MSYSKFRLKDSNKTIYYKIEDNALYNDEGQLLSLPPEKPLDFYESVQPLFGTRKKINKPVALRILFGHACNYSCSYCMQKDIGNPDERPQNKQLDAFIKSIEDNLDLENLERIELWGGEPFLYWNDIQPVMKYLDKKGRHFFISTNGSPLRQKHVDFFKSLEASVMMAVSHDGPGQELLRGEDILYKDSVIKTLKQLDDLFPKVQFSFNCVVSLQNHDLFKINDYFRKASDRIGLKNIRLSYILGRIYDATNSQNSADHVMNKDALVEFKKILNDYIEAEIQQLKTLGFSRTLPMLQSNLVSGEIGAYSYAKKMRHQVPITMTSNCGADAADILSLDIMGNIRLCPHTSENYIAGHINNLKGIRIVQLDLNRKKTHCADCNVRRLCKSSCPIEFPDEVFLQNCRVEKVWYGAIQNKALKLIFGEDVELVELGIQDINEDRLKENSRTQVVA
jgi:uncharacterized protein